MKRVPLKRKTPLSRGTILLRRSRLSPMSKERKGWMKEYRERCAVDGKGKGEDRHHPMGRIGEYILCYIIIPKIRHNWIHHHGTEARELGWLLAPYEGRPYDSQESRAWRKTDESHWPEKYKRAMFKF